MFTTPKTTVEIDPNFDPADQVWPCIPEEEKPDPLLDLDTAWASLAESELIPTSETLPEDVDLRNAATLIRELKQHLLASTHGEIRGDGALPAEDISSGEDKSAEKPAGDETSADSSAAVDDAKTVAQKDNANGAVDTENESAPVDAPKPDAVAETEVVDEEEEPESTGSTSSVANTADAKDATDEPSGTAQSAAVTDPTVESRPNTPRSVYGAALMLKFRWEDRTAQKAVPHRTYMQFAEFIVDITEHLKDLEQTNPTAFQAVADAIALDLTPVLLARLLDGIETSTPELETACDALLQLCARRAAPREMHLAFVGFMKKVDSLDYDDVSYLIADPLLRAWTEVLPRIARKRSAFLNELLKVHDKMLYDKGVSMGDTFGGKTVTGEDDVQVLFPGRTDDVADLMLRFLQRLVVVQREHRESSTDIKESVDFLGHSLPSFAISPGMSKLADAGSDVNTEEVMRKPAFKTIKRDEGKAKDGGTGNGEGEKEGANVQVVEEASDWVKERATTLGRALQLLSRAWSNLPGPPGDGEGEPIRKEGKKKRAAKAQRARAVKQAADESAEETVVACMRLLDELGWCNPVLVCQVAASAMRLEIVSEGDELMRGHIGVDVRSRNQRRKSLYSVAAVGQVVCAFLRPETLRRWGRLAAQTEHDVEHYTAILEGSGFDLLTAEHALNLALPYVTTMISQSAAATRMSGLIVMRTLLEQIPEQHFRTVGDVVKLRSGTSTLGREGSLLGTGLLIMKAVSGLDDSAHRAHALETLQALLRRCQHPLGRFLVLETALAECDRLAVAGQIVTELKDVVHYSNVNAGQEWWSDKQAGALTDRFLQTVLPRYLAPRRDMLAMVNVTVPAAAAAAYVAMRDARARSEGRADECAERGRLLKAQVKLGRECVRAVAAVAEHDRKTVPTSKLAEKSRGDAQALFAASGRTLNQCVSALTSLSLAEDKLSDV